MARTTLSLIGALLIVHAAAHAADAGKLVPLCEGCHGPNGISTESDVPIIGGQSASFIADSLTSFARHGRPCKRTEFRYGETDRPAITMCETAAQLSAEDIASLAAHFSALPFIPAEQAFDPSAVAAGMQIYQANCESCHPDGGRTAGRGPIIAGQWTPYLERAMSEVKTAEHQVPPLMERELTRFDTDQVDALLNFFASGAYDN